MNRFKVVSIKVLGTLKNDVNLILLISSIFSFLIISLYIFGVINNIPILLLPCSIFMMLFLPTYPLFFYILKFNRFNQLERLSTTIVVNLSVYVVGGYFGFLLGFPVSVFYFFYYILIIYVILIIILFAQGYRKKNFELFRLKTYQNGLREDFSFFRYLKNKVSINGILLIIFISLILTLYMVAVPIIGGTDPWLHISIIKVISEVNLLPVDEYFGAMGLHIFCAAFHQFSGLDVIFIPKYFTIYTFPVGCLIAYNIFRRIFKNKNLAIFGIYVLSFSSLGFTILLYQFWPSAITFIQGMFIFFLLFTRFRRFISEKPPSMKEIKSGLLVNYLIIALVFTSCFLSHSLMTLIIVIPYLLVYVVYFFKNIKRGFDLLLLVGLMGIFLILYLFNIGTGHLKVFIRFFELPLPIVLGVIFLAAGVVIGYTLYERRRLVFTKGRFRSILEGKTYNYYKVIEDKYIIPIFILTITILTIIVIIGNSFYYNFNSVAIFSGMEILIFMFLALWGLGIYQNKPKGKMLWLWGLACIFLIIAGILFDALSNSFTFFSRIAYLASLIAVIGFISYIYKLIKLGNIHTLKVKIFLSFILIFSLLSTFSEQISTVKVFSLTNRDVSSIHWYSNYTSTNNTVIGKNGWGHAFIYYGYPFNNYSTTVPFLTTINFIDVNNTYMHPDSHIDSNGDNILKKLKDDTNSDVFLILSDYYLLTKGLTFFGELTPKEMEQYYGLDYLNRVFSAKSEDGGDVPYYWVI